jgi:hypothetical protein
LPLLEKISKSLAIVSVIAIAILQIGVNPDMTPLLQTLATLALVAGWLAAGSSSETIHAAWVFTALLAPAVLRVVAGREGPVLDVFWMAGLTASLLRTTSWSRWSLLGGGTRILAGGWALMLALAWPVLMAREIGFDWHLLFDLGAINSWGLRSAPQVVSWTTFVVWTHLLGLLWLDWLAARFADAPAHRPRALHGLWIGTTLASLVAVYQGVADLTFLNTVFWADILRATGTLLDANAYGTCAALAGPAAFLALHASRSTRAGAIVAVVFAINLAGLWMSGSRTASVCAIVGVAAVALALWQSADARTRRRMPIAAGGVLALGVAMAFAAGAAGPATRLFETPEDSSRGVLSEAFNRYPYGPVAMAIIRDYPISGVGIGSYQDVATDYWRRTADQSLPFDHAQNWWRHQAAELGLLGALPLFLWSGLIAWRVVTARSRPDRGVDATMVRGALLAIGIGSLIQIPTQPPVILLWFMLLLAWLPSLIMTGGQGLRGDAEPAAATRHSGGGRTMPVAAAWVGVAVVAVAYATSHVALAGGRLGVVERAKQFQREYVVGAYGLELQPDGGQFRWIDDEARFVWPARTRWFVIQLWAHHPDIAERPVRVSIIGACGIVFDQTLDNPDSLTVGIVLPEGWSALDAIIRVSRTWQPSPLMGGDGRRLGVAVAANSVPTREQAMATRFPVQLQPCGREGV